MGKQRVTCPYCGKLSKDMYYSESIAKRAKVLCENCSRTYFVLYGEGQVISEKR